MSHEQTRNNTKNEEKFREVSCYFVAEKKTLLNPIGDKNIRVALFRRVAV